MAVEGRQDMHARRVSSPIVRMEMKEERGTGVMLANKRTVVKKMERKAVAKRRVVCRGGMLGGK